MNTVSEHPPAQAIVLRADEKTRFAALILLQDRVIGDCHKRNWHQEFLKSPRHVELTAAMGGFLSVWNQNPDPFVWTAGVDSIPAKFAHCRQTLVQPGCTLPRPRKRK